MAKKFGSIIECPQPVLIGFYNRYCIGIDGFHENLRNINAMFGTDCKVVKIDEVDNHALFEVLHIEKMPTYILYVNEEMVWRHGGHIGLEAIETQVKQQLFKLAVANGA